MRDITLGSTEYFKFTTRAFATGIPTTLAGTPVISVYEENNLTQITAGVTLTVDYDTVTGLNDVAVVATSGNGYETGKSYYLVITTGTVGGVSVVGEVVGEFSVGNSAAFEIVNNGTYGNAQLVRSTTPANTLDVDASGDVTAGTVGDKTGYSLAATGLDAIVSTATGMVEIAKAVWDRILTGATHNIATSAGRRLRGIQEFQGYEEGSIWIDTVNGTAGTVDYENGTVENPVSTIADANTLAASLGITQFKIIAGSSITFAAAQSNQVFDGHNWTLALGGQNIAGTKIIGATISGIAGGAGTNQTFERCILNAITHIKGTRVIESSILSTQTVGEAGDYFFDRCHSGIAGTATWVFDFGALIGNTNLNWRNGSGGIQLESMGDTGTDTASIEGRGQIIEGTCTGGTVAVRGCFTVSGITNLTLSDDARFDAPRQVDLTWDEPLSGHTTNQTPGKVIKGISEAWVSAEGSVNDASATTTSFITDLTSAVTSFYSDTVLVFITGALTGQSRPIASYNGTTKAVSFDEAFTSAPANADQFIVLNGHTHPISEISAQVMTDLDANGSTVIDAIKADTAAIVLDTGTDGVVISTATAQAIADEILKRDFSSVSGESARSMLNALRFLRNKWSISGTTLTVTKEDDATSAWTSTVSTDAAADPITGNDPA